MTGLTCPRLEALVPGTEDKCLPQLKASPLQTEREWEQKKTMNQPKRPCVIMTMSGVAPSEAGGFTKLNYLQAASLFSQIILGVYWLNTA